MKKTRCYIYARVSTAIQVDGYSLDAQKDKLRKYAEFQDMEIVLNVGFYIYLNRKSATVFNKMVDYLKKALIYGHISRISS